MHTPPPVQPALVTTTPPADAETKWPPDCPNCGAPPKKHVMKNFDPVGRYADIHCGECGTYVRDWDPN